MHPPSTLETSSRISAPTHSNKHNTSRQTSAQQKKTQSQPKADWPSRATRSCGSLASFLLVRWLGARDAMCLWANTWLMSHIVKVTPAPGVVGKTNRKKTTKIYVPFQMFTQDMRSPWSSRLHQSAPSPVSCCSATRLAVNVVHLEVAHVLLTKKAGSEWKAPSDDQAPYTKCEERYWL